MDCVVVAGGWSLEGEKRWREFPSVLGFISLEPVSEVSVPVSPNLGHSIGGVLPQKRKGGRHCRSSGSTSSKGPT